MSTWILCKCGERIGTGSFPNNHVYRLVSEVDYEGLEDPVDRVKVAGLFLRGGLLAECPRCGRLHIERSDSKMRECFAREDCEP